MSSTSNDYLLNAIGYHSLPSMSNQDRRRQNRPDFPSHNFSDFQRTHFSVGDQRDTNYTTSSQDAQRSYQFDPSQRGLDTATLQRTHWTGGNFPTEAKSEYASSFRGYTTDATRDPSYTRDEMMRTTFTLGTDEPMESRQRAPQYGIVAEPTPNYRDMMVSSHFSLADQKAPAWETTHKASFREYPSNPSQMANMDLQRGAGAKDCFENFGAFPTPESCEHEAYKPHPQQETRGPRVTVRDGTAEFAQTNSQKWQKTNWTLGGYGMTYSTTTGDAIQARPDCHVNPDVARERRQMFNQSHVMGSSHFPTITKSEMKESFTEHPGFHRPPNAPKTAFESHQKFGDWPTVKTTTASDAFVEHPIEVREKIDHKLQETHAAFGSDAFNEHTSLYQDSYKRPQQTLELADTAAARAFHMGTHSQITSGDRRTGSTTYQAEFTGYPGARPSDMCDVLKGSNNVVPNEPTHVVRESATHAAYRRPPAYQQPPAVDNKLQKSHIPMKGGFDEWTTTNDDYFLWERYRMPKEPF